jgi:hypothetical protein
MFFFVFESTKTRIFEENFKRKHPVIDRPTSVGSKNPAESHSQLADELKLHKLSQANCVTQNGSLKKIKQSKNLVVPFIYYILAKNLNYS